LKIILIGMVILSTGCVGPSASVERPQIEQGGFNAERAYQDLLFQTNLGPRIPGSKGHQQVQDWLVRELRVAGWSVERQVAEIDGFPTKNILAYRERQMPYILLGAHYDTRIWADHDPDQSLREEPVPGANDGASGVAVLLELARTLPEDLPTPVRLVFFDAEDNGGIGEWDWILGSRAFVRDLRESPEAVIIVDMVGDADLELYYERNSNPSIRAAIWDMAAAIGYGDVFLPEERYSMLDDHTPFLDAGIPAVDIIDFDYPYWHTTQDTADKVRADSLKAVGDTLTAWLLEQ
jgi:hypothetical protein